MIIHLLFLLRSLLALGFSTFFIRSMSIPNLTPNIYIDVNRYRIICCDYFENRARTAFFRRFGRVRNLIYVALILTGPRDECIHSSRKTQFSSPGGYNCRNGNSNATLRRLSCPGHVQNVCLPIGAVVRLWSGISRRANNNAGPIGSTGLG